LQHVRRDAARRAGLSATDDPCWLLTVHVYYLNSSQPDSQEPKKRQLMWFMTGVRKYS